jgi:hypothetical protein
MVKLEGRQGYAGMGVEECLMRLRDCLCWALGAGQCGDREMVDSWLQAQGLLYVEGGGQLARVLRVTAYEGRQGQLHIVYTLDSKAAVSHQSLVQAGQRMIFLMLRQDCRLQSWRGNSQQRRLVCEVVGVGAEPGWTIVQIDGPIVAMLFKRETVERYVYQYKTKG